MAKLTITKAIELSPYSKTYFYKKYIKGGLISVSVDKDAKKYIESSELVRVFPELKKPESVPAVHDTSDQVRTGSELKSVPSSELKHLHQQIAELKKDKEFLQSQLLRLSPPPKRQSRISKWWYGLDDKSQS